MHASLIGLAPSFTDGERDVIKKTAIILVFLLVGCGEKTEVFGIEIGGPLQTIRDKNLIAKEDIIPSKHHFVMIDLKKAPENEMGDIAQYSASALNGKIIGATASIDDEKEQYFKSMVSYAEKLLGNPIATNEGIKNPTAAKFTPYGCINNNSCPNSKYVVFRKGDINAIVSTGSGKSVLQFDSDKIKDALSMK